MQPAAPLTAAAERARVRVRGAVQGVGFRPFVYHLAHRYQLGGFVANDADGVLIEVEGRRCRSSWSRSAARRRHWRGSTPSRPKRFGRAATGTSASPKAAAGR